MISFYYCTLYDVILVEIKKAFQLAFDIKLSRSDTKSLFKKCKRLYLCVNDMSDEIIRLYVVDRIF